MSGPKLSEAELEKLRRQEEEKRKAYQDLVRERDTLTRALSRLERLERTLIPLRSIQGMSDLSNDVRNREKKVRDAIDRVKKAMDNNRTEEMKKVMDKTVSEFSSLEDFLNEAETKAFQAQSEYMENAMKQFKSTDSSKESGKSEKSKETGYIAVEATVIPTEIINSEIERIRDQLEDLENRAPAAHISAQDVKTIRQKFEKVAQDSGRTSVSMYNAVHQIDLALVRPMESRIRRIERQNDELDKKLSDELARYHELCSECGVEPKLFPFSEDSVTAIRYECGKLLDHLDDVSVSDTLMENVRNILTEHGYQYLGEKEESRKVRREIYRFHDNVIIHVVYDARGHMTMEVAYQDTVTREPGTMEIENIVKEQENFCGVYDTLFDAINKAGTAMRDVTRYDCDSRFARVINTTEFNCPQVSRRETLRQLYDNRSLKYMSAPMN